MSPSLSRFPSKQVASSWRTNDTTGPSPLVLVALGPTIMVAAQALLVRYHEQHK